MLALEEVDALPLYPAPPAVDPVHLDDKPDLPAPPGQIPHAPLPDAMRGADSDATPAAGVIGVAAHLPHPQGQLQLFAR